MIRDVDRLLTRLRSIHAAIRNRLVTACEQEDIEELSTIMSEDASDTYFVINGITEEVVLRQIEQLAQERSFILIMEGVNETGDDGIAFPLNIDPYDAELRIIINPIDGRHGLVYQKRSAWILTGVAPNKGPATNITDIELALQTEIPLVKQHLSDSLWAIAGNGIQGERYNRVTGERRSLLARPSQAKTIAQGYGSIARFFPGNRTQMASIEDALYEEILGASLQGKVQAFEDQYISTGGQLYELMMGHNRWLADLRTQAVVWQNAGLCCHPYDLCTELIAREAGVIVTNEYGQRLHSPLDDTTNLSWMGYANPTIQQQVAPVLDAILRQRFLL